MCLKSSPLLAQTLKGLDLFSVLPSEAEEQINQDVWASDAATLT